ncbi:MAG TPA: hypothetical protein PK245_01050 [Clostridia bacterium]|mgnify:CR=1 FL=1|nr:hypothetical protein [Clostridia bacterium]
MKERKLKLATMIITLIFGLGCIGLGAAAATKAPTAVANTSKIDISMLGEPQADITIIGVLGSLGINNSPGYPVIWGTENTANPYYITLGPGTSRQIDYTGAQTLLSWTAETRRRRRPGPAFPPPSARRRDIAT